MVNQRRSRMYISGPSCFSNPLSIVRKLIVEGYGGRALNELAPISRLLKRYLPSWPP